MNAFYDLVEKDRRLVILRALEQSGEYRSNGYLLQSLLGSLGHVVSVDRVCGDLAWLDEQGLLHLEDVSGVAIASLTQRGADVALGRVQHPGVKRPTPGA